MKIAVFYFSRCHGNTLKVLEAMTRGYDVELFDVCSKAYIDLENYDIIGFASGIYFGQFHKSVIKYAEQYLPNNKNVFFVFTGGAPFYVNTSSIKKAIADKNPKILGQYSCRGYDTYKLFKSIGGIAKGHPNQRELKKANAFFNKMLKKVNK